MDKPHAKLHEPAFHWQDLAAWIKMQTGRSPTDWLGKFERVVYDPTVPYENFWHLICDLHELSNGSYFYLDLDPNSYEQEFAKEIIKFLASEFPEEAKMGEMYCWVGW